MEHLGGIRGRNTMTIFVQVAFICDVLKRMMGIGRMSNLPQRRVVRLALLRSVLVLLLAGSFVGTAIDLDLHGAHAVPAAVSQQLAPGMEHDTGSSQPICSCRPGASATTVRPVSTRNRGALVALPSTERALDLRVSDARRWLASRPPRAKSLVELQVFRA
ncbi:MAG TPA: hypothetical protein VE074_17800 [Jatrophihabitantaceae bacterium]|nr:hypothetical protein [Jatrophihabitantaceae bacterium]